jgi:hypothetical protein
MLSNKRGIDNCIRDILYIFHCCLSMTNVVWIKHLFPELISQKCYNFGLFKSVCAHNKLAVEVYESIFPSSMHIHQSSNSYSASFLHESNKLHDPDGLAFHSAIWCHSISVITCCGVPRSWKNVRMDESGRIMSPTHPRLHKCGHNVMHG